VPIQKALVSVRNRAARDAGDRGQIVIDCERSAPLSDAMERYGTGFAHSTKSHDISDVAAHSMSVHVVGKYYESGPRREVIMAGLRLPGGAAPGGGIRREISRVFLVQVGGSRTPHLITAGHGWFSNAGAGFRRRGSGWCDGR